MSEITSSFISPSNTAQIITLAATMAVPGANNMIIYDPAALQDSVDKLFGKNQFPSSFFSTDTLSKLNSAADAVFRFTINPMNADVSKGKVRTVTQTKAGFETQYWRNNLMRISYKGKTPAFKAPINYLTGGAKDTLTKNSSIIGQGINNVLSDIRLSPAWIKFQRFQEFYDNQQGDSVMIWDGVFYLGWLDDFNFTVEGPRPESISYSFVFIAYPDKIVNLFTKIPSLVTSVY
mgnify:CR=1 FL=1